MKYTFSIIIAFFALAACQPKEKPAKEVIKKLIFTDSLAYQNQVLYQETGDCAVKETNCAYISVKYPLFDETQKGNAKINAFVKEIVLNPVLKDYTVESAYSDFISQFLESYRKRRPEPNDSLGWYEIREVKVISNLPNLITLQYHEVTFSGGDTPNRLTYFRNIEWPQVKELTFETMVNEDSLPALHAIAEQKFRQQLAIDKGKSLKEAGYFFDENRFKLNDNVAVTDKGLLFVFNPYEIAPSKSGTIELFFPYTEISHCLRSSSAVAKLTASK